MTASSLVMMIMTLGIVWGGLASAITYLVRHPIDAAEG
ncbi:MAG: methionine/alanine import family NSS transporter small subunit [Actinomycetaceae bacterium]|nr:methionine/alanine import family NSS transporter small subunit [Actinomycetaceae bacterium]MDY6083185.1 methionine/alanine import family NSS transporter small subunit [Actinomycetaceae bacterium]